MTKLLVDTFAGVTAKYRNEGDVRVLREVLEKKVYRRVSDNFDVEPGESWLDLGANIGAFALYAKQRGASTVDCYEPSLPNWRVLNQNYPGAVQSAVSVSPAPSVQFYDHDYTYGSARGTLLEIRGFKPADVVPNLCAKSLISFSYDGVKMDIEGSEGPIIDKWWLPKTKKLVMEYHTSRDQSVANLAARLKKLQSKFRHVVYPEEYDRCIASGAHKIMTHPGDGVFVIRFDRMIYCMDPK